ncbi:gamma carbonic anhydrase family protein [Thalassomonas sp. M1454]|uniref:gamma carbonic anhydrase family protein n=1 Tax=Thalassomonas sp. M1454 TaxID=2594477 RepID=UPI00117EA314|nr:gamma carbonic anhydrase family protein [Thalassomonas sp. M1454]TRX58172.1 gamma carbonic anhydrase family protein [Thalassomonas sp. M1454]
MTTSNIRSYRNHQPQLGNNVYVDPTSTIIGKISLADDTSIWPMVVARGDVNVITIGKRSNIQDGSVLHVSRVSDTYPNGFPLSIGEDVTVGHKVMLHGCTLHDRILVGMGAIVMDGAVVQSDVIIGAGSLVPPNKTLQSGYLYVGNPVKQSRLLKDTELAFLKKTAANYVLLKNEYIEEQSKSYTY